MIQEKNTNSDIVFLVLARPADGLSALVRDLLMPQEIVVCESAYDVIAALLTNRPDRPTILISRPRMLAQPHLADALRQYPNLRLIGWLGSFNPYRKERPHVDLPMVTVSTSEELADVIRAMSHILGGPSAATETASDKKLDPAEYRLSDDELEALLGTEQ